MRYDGTINDDEGDLMNFRCAWCNFWRTANKYSRTMKDGRKVCSICIIEALAD